MAGAASTFVYVTYIRTTQERLWAALTTPEEMKKFWFGYVFDTEWKAGAPWRLVHSDGRVADTGEFLEFDPPRRMVLKWRNELRPELTAEGYCHCTIELAPEGSAVKLTVIHEHEQPGAKIIQAVSGGWPRILSNLKSLLETGETAV